MDNVIEIDSSQQTLQLLYSKTVIFECLVSTAKNGLGEIIGSECTPRGRHMVAEKIGAGCPIGAVFVARKPTGEIYSKALGEQFPERDWILTRILWLTGIEQGKNQGPGRDTYKRYIYIHGTPDTTILGQIGSRGCIRVANQDMLQLFDKVSIGTFVKIR